MKSKLEKLQALRDPMLSKITMLKGDTGDKGDKGDTGEAGYSPIKGKDYYTESEINFIIKYIQSNVKDGIQGIPGKDGRDGQTPIRGIDFWSPKDQEKILQSVLSKIPKPKDGITPNIEDIVRQVKEEINKNPPHLKDIKGTTELIEFLKRGGFRGGGGGGSGGGGTPALPFTSVQFNNAGAFGGSLLNYVGTTTADFSTPDGVGTDSGVDFNFQAGNGGASGGNGASINFNAGSANGGDGNGGSFQFEPGLGSGAGSNGVLTFLGFGSQVLLDTNSLLLSSNGILKLENGNTYQYNFSGTNGDAILDASLMSSNHTFLFPNEDGTIALSTDLANYVPYNGANQPVNIFPQSITTGAVFVENSDLFYGQIESTLLTANRAYDLPDNGGYILATSGALTSDLLFGWDNTDGMTTPFNIGTNLTYDHSTHTLNAAGGTPTLTATQIAFGDVSNLMTSSANFTWIDSTNTLNLGTNAVINASSLDILGNGGNSELFLDSTVARLSNVSKIYLFSGTNLYNFSGGSFDAILDASNMVTANRTFTFPDQPGIFVVNPPDANTNINVLVQAGNAVSGDTVGGNVTLSSGSATGNADAGDIVINGGFGSGTGTGADFIVNAGGGGSSGGKGGSSSFTGGNGGGGNSNGGDVLFSPGQHTGSGTDGQIKLFNATNFLAGIFNFDSLATVNRIYSYPDQDGIVYALPDPGANTIAGWDDTDNAPTNFLIGSGLTYTHSTHTLSASGGGSGVTSITGTANQVIASASTGAVTLSLPQSIATTSTPQFAKIGIGAAADANRLLYVTGNVSGGVATIERTNATTSAVVGTAIIKGTSTGGTAAAGFGSAFQFAMGDTGTAEVITGNIQSVLSGGSLASAPSADLNFTTLVGGSLIIPMVIKGDGRINFNLPAYTSGSDSAFVVTPGAHTNQTASTEETDINFNLARTVQFATGALTTQRAMRIQAPTYSFVGASTITNAATMDIAGAPIAGTNATITNAYAARINTGQTTAVGLRVTGQTSQTAPPIQIQSDVATVGGGRMIGFNHTDGNEYGVIASFGAGISLASGSVYGTLGTARFTVSTGAVLNAYVNSGQFNFGSGGASYVIMDNTGTTSPIFTIPYVGINNKPGMEIQAGASQTANPFRVTDASSVVKTSISPTGLINNYASVATTGWGVPAIYGTGRSTAQTAAVTSVATYTVGAADGSFWISANVNVTTFAVGTFNVTCTYTDETNTSNTLKLNFSSVTGTLGIAVAAAGAFEGIPAHIRAKAGTTITIATSGTFTSLTYNVEGSINQIA